LNDKQAIARETIVEVEHPEFGRLREVRTAIRVPNQVVHKRPCSALGADGESILKELLGYSDSVINELHQDGVI
jgi:crotonobetainyl-CoA:carnitine CoA-transferase CaiB-like acyl-CoA transferase